MITVFLVDDHVILRRGVADLLEEDGELTVVGQASTTAEALARVPAPRPNGSVLASGSGDHTIRLRTVPSEVESATPGAAEIRP